MRFSGLFVFLVAYAIGASGCAPKHIARLASPARVEAFCAKKEPRLTALLSIMTSTSDAIVNGESLTDASARTLARRTGGVIGYWNDQLLYLPKTAAALGESDEYVRVRAVAALASPEGVASRRLYLKVRSRGADRSQKTTRWISLNAFDVQNPCVEGHRSM